MRRALLLMLLAGLALAAPVAAQTGASEERQAAEEALAEAQALSQGRGIRTGRELSVALVRLAAQRDELSRSDRQEAEELLARPVDVNDTGQTGGPYSTSARVMRNCSEHFCVHWVDSTEDAPPLTDANSCPTPDYVDAVRTAMEQSYAVENGPLGWRAPVSDGGRGGGTALTDVYLKELNSNPNNGLYGYAAPETGSGSSYSGYLVLDDDYAADEFPTYGGNYTKPVQVTAAHEYNHVLQFAYDVFEDPWMFESTATWAEDKVFPLADDWHNYMGRWADTPQEPITADTSREYGSAIWNHYLEQRYGADVIRQAWAGSPARSHFAPHAYGAAIDATDPEGGFETDFLGFAAATVEWTGTNSGILDAGAFPRRVARVDSDPDPAVADTTISPATPRSTTVHHTAYRAYDVTGLSNANPLKLTGKLTAPADPTSGAAGGVALVAIKGNTVTKVVKAFDAAGEAAVILPGNPTTDFDRITAVIVNADVSNDGFDPTADDWRWRRDGQSGLLSVSQPGDAADDEDLVPEPLTPGPSGAPAYSACGTTTVEREPPVVVEPTPSATPTASPTVSPTPTPTPRTSVGLTRSSTRLATVTRKGVLSFFARTNKAGRLSAKATVTATTAKLLKVGRRTTSAGTAKRTFPSPARLKINIKLTRKMRAALKRHRGRAVTVKIAVSFTPDDGTGTVRRTFTLRLRR